MITAVRVNCFLPLLKDEDGFHHEWVIGSRGGDHRWVRADAKLILREQRGESQDLFC
jgi:hypothetical protein